MSRPRSDGGLSVLTLDFDRSPLADDGFFGGKLVAAPRFDPPALSPTARHLAQRAWLERARSEYVGVMIARKLWGLCVDLNTPRDVQELALRMVLDEQRHLSLCIAAAEALGAEPAVAFELPDLQQPRTDAPIGAQLVEMVAGTYAVGEAVALSLVTHAVKALPPSGFRDVLRAIAADEVLHGRIGRALLTVIRDGAGWLTWPGDDAVGAIARRWRDAMRARDVIEDDEVAAFRDAALAAELQAVGVPDPIPFAAAYHRALDDLPAAFAPLGIRL